MYDLRLDLLRLQIGEVANDLARVDDLTAVAPDKCPLLLAEIRRSLDGLDEDYRRIAGSPPWTR